MRAALNPESGNTKTGPIIVWETSSDTCPPSCGSFDICYAKHHFAAQHWKKLDAGKRGMSFEAFLVSLADLARRKPGTLARGNQWGDQPGIGDTLDIEAFRALVSHASGLRAFSYSHKPLTPTVVREFRSATELGYVVNVSADTPRQVDAAIAAGLPAVLVVPHDAPKVVWTPGGIRGVACPATQRDDISCGGGNGKKACGNGDPLCFRKDRSYAVTFPAHGNPAAVKAVTRRYEALSAADSLRDAAGNPIRFGSRRGLPVIQ